MSTSWRHGSGQAGPPQEAAFSARSRLTAEGCHGLRRPLRPHWAGPTRLVSHTHTGALVIAAIASLIIAAISALLGVVIALFAVSA